MFLLYWDPKHGILYIYNLNWINHKTIKYTRFQSYYSLCRI